MTGQFTLDHAVVLAANAHAGHRDPHGDPTIVAAIRVMARFDEDELRIIAVLRDTVALSEGRFTVERLRRCGATERTCAAIDAMTARPGEASAEIAKRLSLNDDALTVCEAVLLDMADQSRTSAARRLASVPGDGSEGATDD